MRSTCTALAVAALLATGASGAGGCSNGDGTEEEDERSITIGYFNQPDALDPALGQTIPATAALSQVYTPLLTYHRVEGGRGTELIPGLATGLPKVSADGLTYTLRLRDELEYADGTPVRASDFEHELKRVLHLGSPGAPFYEHIAGAAEYERNPDPDADLSGVETDDGTGRIVVRLDRPYAPFEHLLALTFAAPVPATTPFENTTPRPPAATGPFRITRSDPDREFVLERNPSFESLGIDGVAPAKVDRITVKIVPDKVKQAEDVLSNKLDYMSDSPPPDMLPTVKKEAPDRYEEHLLVSTNWFFMNGRLPPFDDPRVRRAVNFGVDKPALAKVYAGQLEPGCSFLPRGIAGYEEELDTSDCPFGDPRESPDLARARSLIRAAGAEGAKVTVWGYDQTPQGEAVQAYAGMLDELGFDADVKLVDFAVWRQTIGNAKNKPQTGLDAWTAAFPHPLTYFELVTSDAIRPTNNKNTSNIEDPVIDATVRRLEAERDAAKVSDDWSRLNRYLVDQAYIVPFGHRIRATFVSDRVDFANCTFFHQIYLEDWSHFCVKEGGE